MSWTAPSGHVFVTGEVVTAATLNTYVRLNLDDLDRRTSPVAATVLTGESTTATAYNDLATVGPAVTVTIGSTGKALVAIYTSVVNNSGNFSLMSYAVSGATTVAGSDTSSIQSAGATDIRAGATLLHTGLTAGSTTFTTKYRVTSGTGTFTGRRILVQPLGS